MEKHLADLVLEFASKMNAIEREIVELDEKNPDEDYFDEYERKYLAIFREYCTDKKRTYGGNADSYGSPSKYDGIENFIEQKTTIKNKNRAEVYYKTNNDFEAEYLFVVLRKNGIWKIDNAKYKWYGNEKWQSMII